MEGVEGVGALSNTERSKKQQRSKRPSQVCSICNTKSALMGNATERGGKTRLLLQFMNATVVLAEL